MQITLFELDGYTDYRQEKNSSTLTIVNNKRGYIRTAKKTEADGEINAAYENYKDFPIVPLWANDTHQSELEGKREQIDAYDLIKSGFANDLDDASMIYWTLSNTGGMDDIDLAQFVERMKTIKAAVVGDGDDSAKAEAHTIDVPYQSREVYLNRLETDLYKEFMAINTDLISAGNITATQIRASYEALNEKTDELEMNLYDFFDRLLYIANIDDKPTFTRSKIVNISEEIETTITAAEYIGEEEVTRRICSLLGLSDKFDDIMNKKIADEMNRFEEEKDTENE